MNLSLIHRNINNCGLDLTIYSKTKCLKKKKKILS